MPEDSIRAAEEFHNFGVIPGLLYTTIMELLDNSDQFVHNGLPSLIGCTLSSSSSLTPITASLLSSYGLLSRSKRSPLIWGECRAQFSRRLAPTPMARSFDPATSSVSQRAPGCFQLDHGQTRRSRHGRPLPPRPQRPSTPCPRASWARSPNPEPW